MKINHFLILAFLGSALFAYAQPKKDNENGLNQEIITIGNRSIRLRDAYRIANQPQIFDTVITKANVSYSVQPAFVKTRYEVSPIAAANLKIVEPLSKLYRGYVRAGAGMYSTPLAELYYNSVRSREGGFGLHLKHLSSSGQINNVVGNSGFSDNKAQLWGKYFIKKHALSGELLYKRNKLGFYGIDPVFEARYEAQRAQGNLLTPNTQRYEYLGGNAKIESYYDDLSKLNHAVDLAYYNFKDQQGSKEDNINAKIDFSKLYNKELYKLSIGVDHNKFKSDTVPDFGTNDQLTALQTSTQNTIISFSPQISSIGEKYKLKVGLSLFGQIDTAGNKFYFFPNAEFSYNLVDKVLMPYAGLNGNVERNSYFKTTQRNPFVLSALQLSNTVNKLNIYGGLRGNLSANTAFNLLASYIRRDNMQFFTSNVKNTNGFQNRFDAIYDDVNIANLTAELSYHQNEKLQFVLRADYFSYDTDSIEKAWNMPAFKLNLNGRYNLRDKFYITTDVFVESNRFAFAFENTSQDVILGDEFKPVVRNIGSIVDLNLGFEYRYTKRLSAFLNANNLIANAYQKYYLYPVQSINILGGISFSF